MTILYISILSFVMIFAGVAGLLLYAKHTRKKRYHQKKQQYKNIIGQVVEIVWGKECFCVGAGGTGWRVELIDQQFIGGDSDSSLLGRKVRILDMTGEYTVSVSLLPTS